jgi:hypothetical protein
MRRDNFIWDPAGPAFQVVEAQGALQEPPQEEGVEPRDLEVVEERGESRP